MTRNDQYLVESVNQKQCPLEKNCRGTQTDLGWCLFPKWPENQRGSGKLIFLCAITAS